MLIVNKVINCVDLAICHLVTKCINQGSKFREREHSIFIVVLYETAKHQV